MSDNVLTEKISKEASVRNAGLVIFNAYIPVLFERPGLTDGRFFISPDLRARAPHFLQYIATGLSDTQDEFLLLNKVLCGLPVTGPITPRIDISKSQNELIKGLLSTLISHWSSIGNCSIDGFRGNWLQRDGILAEENDAWKLTVEKRAYDVLISRSPFSFSLIKYPWMDKPIHVLWSF